MTNHINAKWDLSKSFLFAYRRCMQYDPRAEIYYWDLPIPASVCLSFSTELALKAVLEIEGKTLHLHNLRELYDNLSKESSERIRRRLNLPDNVFDNLLNEMGNSFVNLRYYYENKKGFIETTFLVSITNELHSIIQDHRSNNNVG